MIRRFCNCMVWLIDLFTLYDVGYEKITFFLSAKSLSNAYDLEDAALTLPVMIEQEAFKNR